MIAVAGLGRAPDNPQAREWRPLLVVWVGELLAGASFGVASTALLCGEHVLCSLAGDGRAVRHCEARTLVLVHSSDSPRLVRVGIDNRVALTPTSAVRRKQYCATGRSGLHALV